MTVGEIVARVRETVDDNVLSIHRVTDESLCRMVIDGCRALRRICPAACYYHLQLDAEPLPTNPTNSTVLRIDTRWSDALWDYVCYRCFCLDANENNNRASASEHLSHFNSTAGLR